MSRPDLRSFYVSILVWSGCDLGGHSMFKFLCFLFLCVWPGMVLNQGQLSIVVSDWESYLGSFSPLLLCGILFFCLCAGSLHNEAVRSLYSLLFCLKFHFFN
jgi:hypothetical protein